MSKKYTEEDMLRIVEIMRKAGGVNRVAADIHMAMADNLQGILSSYYNEQADGGHPPSPADFMLGWFLWSIGQYESIGKSLIKRGTEGVNKDVLKQIIDIGCMNLLASIMKDAGVDAEYLKLMATEWASENLERIRKERKPKC